MPSGRSINRLRAEQIPKERYCRLVSSGGVSFFLDACSKSTNVVDHVTGERPPAVGVNGRGWYMILASLGSALHHFIKTTPLR